MEELIGRRAKVRSHTAPDLIGIEGTVLDETRNTFVIGTDRKRTVVPKKGSRIAFTRTDGDTFVLDGDRLMFRPEDRIKRCDKVPNGSVEKGC
jgi:ribonuclease P protein subunit POP4